MRDNLRRKDDMPATAEAIAVQAARKARTRVIATAARGEPALFLLGGALAFGIVMILGFLLLVFWNGIVTFWPSPIHVATLADGSVVAGEQRRTEPYRVAPAQLAQLPPDVQRRIRAEGGYADRTLYRTGNFDLYNDDYKWVSEFEVAKTETPPGLYFIERLEWGPFIGRIKSVDLNGQVIEGTALDARRLAAAHDEARARWKRIRQIEHNEIGHVNHEIESERLQARKAALRYGDGSPEHRRALAEVERTAGALKADYDRLSAEAQAIKATDEKYNITLAEIGGREKTAKLSELVRYYPANELGIGGKLGVYLSRWGEFLIDEPREANTEGGVLPAIFGTFAMTLLMVIAVTPFGVITALYLREYAKQGRLVSAVRI